MITSTEVELLHSDSIGLGNWLRIQNCPVDRPPPKSLPLTMGTPLPCLTCFPTCPLSHLLPSLLPTHTMILLELKQITSVHHNRN